jgi:hypothetical protein
MADENDDPELVPRLPTLDDLLLLCQRLNECGAKYLVVGGWAVIQHGFDRTTGDIDLLVDTAHENVERIRQAMLGLPDGAIREMRPDDLDNYVVVRVGDEFVVDLMKAACGIAYTEASDHIEWITIQGVRIPFGTPELLLRMKQTPREKDMEDRLYLEHLLKQRGNKGLSPPSR